MRGKAAFLLGDPDRALTDLNDAIWLDRKAALAYLERGRVYVRKDDLDRAVADFNQALAQDPLLAEAYRARGDIFWLRSDIQAAWTDYDQALALNPADAESWLGRGRAWSARRDSGRAMADFDRAIQIAALPRAYLERSRERLRGGVIEAGLADIKRTMELQPVLAGDVLGVVLPQARELSQGKKADLPTCCRLCRETFRLLEPLGKDRPEVRDLVREGLRVLPEDAEPGRCAERLCSVLKALREKVP